MKAISEFSKFFRPLAFVCMIGAMAFSVGTPAQSVDASAAGDFSQISFVANIETAGVVVSGSGLPASAQLTYRRSGEANWSPGHPLMRIKDGRLVGSLFNLTQSTTYEVKVSDGSSEVSGTFTTQPDELSFTPTNVIYVNDDAFPGGDGSITAPFRTIQEGVNRALPGSQVLVADGIYKEAVTFPDSGTSGNWIQVKAEGGGAILDGSISIPVEEWKPMDGKPNVWFTKVNPGIKYLARDGLRFYKYDFLNDLLDANGHNNVPMGEGWFYDPVNARLYVHTNREPYKYTWQVPQFNAAFLADERDWIWIEGFEMRYYGTEFGCGVCSKNSSHIVIRKNRIHNVQNPVFVEWTGGEDRGNDTRIEYNEMSDPVFGEWAWNAVKGTSMESMAIVLRGHIGAIVRGNTIHHYFNGIYTSSSAALNDPGVAFDADIYNNYIHHIGDDALEPEGTCVNHRFRNNKVDSTLVGISLAPITMGPVWILRNTFVNFTARSVKWDRNSDGWVLMYHNTSFTTFANTHSVELISAAQNSILRNNIFHANGYSVEAHNPGSMGHDWNYNNWFTLNASTRFVWEGISYADLNQLCHSAGLDCNGHESSPGLSTDMTLLPNSSNIDRGILLPGINDQFGGSAPDLGAFESGYGIPPTTNTPAPITTDTPAPAEPAFPTVSTILRTDPTPSNAELVHFNVTFSKEVSGVDVGDFILTTTGLIANSSITEVFGSGNSYIVTANTGTGDGTLRLDLVDNDSILDSTFIPLGGAGTGNGDFFAGEIYVNNKNAPSVTSILRADPSPTTAGSVGFTVTFSEPVTGVDAADFAATVIGLSDAGAASVNGAEAAYTVVVNTGSGSGSLRLDLVDNDSILDAAGSPLGGAGMGNGDFTAGDTYIVDRLTPVIQSVSFSSDGAQDGWILESKETSNKGGTLNSNAITFRVGDNAQDNQYRSILQFPTASLPDTAIITQAILTLQTEKIVGTNPFDTHRAMWVDLRQGAFGSFGPLQIGALQISDFQAPASLYNAGLILNNPVGGWYWTNLDVSAFPYINLKGGTQIRLGFQLDDDDDRRDDYLSFFSGNYGVNSARPQLTIKYYVPK
ncbi:MAG: right-handed parallel beta-helix repeat-containing protein [Anaerolineales bacterium]|nr:right-handed parallel beta-helix repeat-containing protein [Anaerolineales bacterium]